MKTIAVCSQKGGAGKTTAALHLAVAAERHRRRAAVFDLDPQGSASVWGELRKKTQGTDGPAVVAASYRRLTELLAAAREAGADLAILDTAPHTEEEAFAVMAQAADVLLIPCRPSFFDLQAIRLTLDLARQAGKPAVVMLNAVPVRGPLVHQAEENVASEQARDAVRRVVLCPVLLGQRSAYVRSLTDGLVAQEYEPEGKAAQEVAALYKWIRGHVGL
ncbi:MAG TPA: ParA family protein [Gemmataceae bacterium]|nr:ParA family protein [Gemmataceae bacterium]